jgi:thioredoxin reductase (NADPH)
MSLVENINNIQECESLLSTYNGILVIDFYATWCGPCKLMLPIYDNLSLEEELKSKVKFLKINRDDNRDLVAKYNFSFPSIPRFFVVAVNNGELEILEDMGGTQSKTSLKEKILLHLKNLNSIEKKKDEQENQNQQNDNNVSVSKPKVAVIGSGPAGLTAGLYLSRANLDVTIFTGEQIGGQLTTTTEIENFPGAWNNLTNEGLHGSELMTTIQNQATHFGAKVEIETISKIKRNSNIASNNTFTLSTKSNQELEFNAVVIASGASSKYLNIDGEKELLSKGYHTCATCDGAWYKDKIVGIIGGGDTAMEEAMFLTNFAQKVYLIHRSTNFKASKIMLDRAQSNKKIEFLTNKQTVKLLSDDKITDKRLNGVEIKDTLDNTTTKLDLDGLFIAIGHSPNSDFAKGLLSIDDIGYLIPQSRLPVEERSSHFDMMSNIEGIFVAGDIEDSVYRQAITAAGNGCKAALDCQRWLQLQEKI